LWVQNERYCLFRNLRETHKNIETLHFGSDEINLNENYIIFNKVRAYIRQTKRFQSQYSETWKINYVDVDQITDH
jgi:hypothetical protein